MIKLDNQTVIITGASRGIGRAIALELARREHEIVVHYGRREDLARVGNGRERSHAQRASTSRCLAI